MQSQRARLFGSQAKLEREEDLTGMTARADALLTHPDTRCTWRKEGTQMRMEQLDTGDYTLINSVDGETPDDEPEFHNYPLSVKKTGSGSLELEFSNGAQVFQGKWSPADGANK